MHVCAAQRGERQTASGSFQSNPCVNFLVSATPRSAPASCCAVPRPPCHAALAFFIARSKRESNPMVFCAPKSTMDARIYGGAPDQTTTLNLFLNFCISGYFHKEGCFVLSKIPVRLQCTAEVSRKKEKCQEPRSYCYAEITFENWKPITITNTQTSHA